MLKRKNYWLLYLIVMLSLMSLSPSMELDTDEESYRVQRPQNQLTYPSTGETGMVERLRISVSLSQTEFLELQALSSSYTQSSGIEIMLSNRDGEDAEQQLKQDLTLGDSPDIIMTDARNILDLATQGYLLPVDVYQSIPGSAPLTGLISLMQWNGYDWGVPLDVDPYVIAYSPERLAGLGIKQLPRSLDEWDQLLQGFPPQDSKYLLALDTRNAYGLSALLQNVGSSLLENDVKALGWVQSHRSQFYLTSRYNEDIWDMLKSGTLAAAVVPLSEWQQRGDSSLAAEAPLTAEKGAWPEALYSRSFALPAQSQNPEEAVKWLAFITSEASQREWMQSTGRLPGLELLYRSGQLLNFDLPFSTDLLLTDEAAPADKSRGGWSEIMEAAAGLLTGKLDAAGYLAATGEADASE